MTVRLARPAFTNTYGQINAKAARAISICAIEVKKYHYQGGKSPARGCIPNRVDVRQRPSMVEEKRRLGD